MKIRLLIGLTITLIYLFNCAGKKPENSYLLQEVVRTVKNNHLSPKAIDDDFSEKLFDYYLSIIDPEKIFLTQQEIGKLQVHRFALDEELESGTLQFFHAVRLALNAGIDRAEQYGEKWLQTPITLTVDEVYDPPGASRGYAVDEDALWERWRKMVKKTFLEELLHEDGAAPETTSMEGHEAIALQRVQQIYRHQFELLKQKNEAAWLEDYINAFLKVNDPQSEYLSPEQKVAWEAAFTRSLVGVGIQFEVEDNHPKIKELMTGGPAWQSKLLAVGDMILRISDHSNVAVDVSGATSEEISDLLRGEKGTPVTLWVRNAESAIREVTLIRDELTLDLAMGFTLQQEGLDHQLGYIKLPRFYAGDEGCAAHVLKCLKLLEAQNIKGLILDLRNNQGGSAREVISIMGHFLESGVVMQAQYQNGNHRIFEDTDGAAAYRKALIVLVNDGSASGSELLSGTMQDYQRAVVVGTKSTYGKGSIQQFFSLNPEEESKPLGEIKLTIGKFFTASGRSAQYHGIIPDIILPDERQYLPSGERVYPYSFIIEDLAPTAVVQQVSTTPDLKMISKKSKDRVAQNERFQLISEKALNVKETSEHPEISLNYETYKRDQRSRRQLEQSYQEIYKKVPGFRVKPIATDVSEPASVERTNYWRTVIEKDPYIQECFWIMQDILG